MFGTTMDAHGSGFHPVVVGEKHSGDEKHGWGSYIWAIIIFIVFIFVVFLAFALIFKRDERHVGGNAMEAMTPLLTAMAVKDCNHNNNGYNHGVYEWDAMRDTAKQFADTRMEIQQVSWTQSRENDKYHYEQRAAIDRNNYDTLLGFKSSEIEGLKNTQKIEARIDGLENRLNQDIIRKQDSEITYLKTVAALAPRPPMPAYIPQYNYGVHGYEPHCVPGCG